MGLDPQSNRTALVFREADIQALPDDVRDDLGNLPESLRAVAEPAAFERANYMKALSSFDRYLPAQAF